MENDHRNSEFSHEKWVDLSIAMGQFTKISNNVEKILSFTSTSVALIDNT